ncbi:ATP-grasp domain-containing protein [Azospirillum sp. TSO35-2]|uniref:ATP-grasp domain-containing protein n=1 Tax=Azospirillum sp. TSO35-2 TaxID=716796 RepID=UPI000D65D7DD|nr:ATP-grasp domain-containing protein [Azospirillum sp. TSO35-2]
MRILVCEFVTGGGMPGGEPIPAGLAHEGDLMLRALVGDLLAVPGVEVVATRDARLPPLPPPAQSIAVADSGEAWALWKHLAGTIDAVWPIAPETDGVLERLSRLVVDGGGRLLNSAPDAVAIAASKSATATALAAAGLPVAPAWHVDAVDDPPDDGPWVVKPDDGAGCEDTRLLRDRADWARWRAGAATAGFIVQPHIAGTAASLSMLCRDGQAWPLTVNTQRVALSGSLFAYQGGIIGSSAITPELSALARGVAAALPGLAGYVGVDFIATPDGPVVLEINPRLTTSYAAIGRATGMNVAAAVLGLLQDPPVPPAPVERPQPVTLDLGAASHRTEKDEIPFVLPTFLQTV